ncbi:MAG TPA: hypothetical protein VMZ53_17775 [Kofleriaceae bacterium]|nr:hypothetical protein [Kofleriaceae bacterium]
MRWFASLLLAGCMHSVAAPTIPPHPGMGSVHFAIDTRAPAAQQHFDAGLAALYGFNYDEAHYEFLVASHADPSCAMCAWGFAYASGPNINAILKQYQGTYESAQQAATLARTPLEKAITKALVARLSPHMMVSTDERSKLDDAYLAAMREAAKLAPSDPDVQTFLAEALWMATPIGVPGYTKDGIATHPNVTEAVSVLEHVLEAHPDHIGAIHFYIHAVDGSKAMEKAVPFAQKLATLAPESGHLVHMPSHLMLKLGRYAEAIDENRAAIASDKRYLARNPKGGEYEMFSMHPRQYLWYVLLFTGGSREATTLASELRDEMQKMAMMDPHAADQAAVFAALVAARFGNWDTALSLPPPSGSMSTIATSFARGLALVAKGKLDEAAVEVEKIRKAPDADTPPSPPPAPAAHGDHADTPAEAPPPMGGPPELFVKKQREYTRALSAAFAAQLSGAVTAARGKQEEAIAELRGAVDLEDAVPDMGELSKPPVTARQRLGALLLTAGRPADAERVYLADLKVFPENGWSLFGLWKALDAQHKPDAAAARARFEAAWKHADIQLTSSVF